MPHVILRGQTDLRVASERFEPGRRDANDWILKLKEIYAAPDGKTALVDCTAVRSGFSQDFYVRIEAKRGITSVRVDPYMRIERNEGVHRAVAAIAGWVRKLAPEMEIDRTNLPPELLADGAGEASAQGGATA